MVLISQKQAVAFFWENIICQKARKTKTLHRGFAKTPYRKARGINANIPQQVSRQIVNFALDHGASTIVFEDLKGWRPQGGRKRSNLKQKFHGWLHRRLVTLTEVKSKSSCATPKMPVTLSLLWDWEAAYGREAS